MKSMIAVVCCAQDMYTAAAKLQATVAPMDIRTCQDVGSLPAAFAAERPVLLWFYRLRLQLSYSFGKVVTVCMPYLQLGL